jgi:hypothetical protein
LDEWQIICKIAEMRSYIASDWPGIEERKTLYRAVAELEMKLKRIKDEAEKNGSQQDKKA